MASAIVFIVILILIKKYLSGGRGIKGLTDIGKVILGLCVAAVIISLLSSWVFWLLVAILLAVIGIFIGKKVAADNRAKKYGWNTAEYNAKYAENLKKFREMYAEESDPPYTSTQNATEKMKASLENEKRAAEKARQETDEYMRSKYGDPAENERLAKEKRAQAKTAGTPKKSGTAKAASGAAAAETKASGSAKTGASQQKALRSKILPKATAKRNKIITAFNQKYELNLTEDQIQRIADASYMSVAWKNEVEAMASKYDSVYGWLVGDTASLRAYLRAFAVMDITSDYKQQMQIVMDSFEQVFEYSDKYSTLSIDQRIEKINREFMTSFDEITYMIAYRYLEALGFKHQLDKTELNRMDGSIDDLAKKYENMSDAQVDSELKENSAQTHT